MADLKRTFEIIPGYDYRDNPEKIQYGQHCMNMRFFVSGELGVVQFVLSTGWYPEMIAKPTADWQELLRVIDSGMNAPMAVDLDYHSPVARYEDQRSMGPCVYLDGKDCFYDGSSLNGYKLLSLMIHEGGEAMWKELEDYYKSTFERKEVANAGNEMV